MYKYQLIKGRIGLFRSQSHAFRPNFLLTRKVGHQTPSKSPWWPSHNLLFVALHREAPPVPSNDRMAELEFMPGSGFGAIPKTVDRLHRIQMHRKHLSFDRGIHRLANCC